MLSSRFVVKCSGSGVDLEPARTSTEALGKSLGGGEVAPGAPWGFWRVLGGSWKSSGGLCGVPGVVLEGRWEPWEVSAWGLGDPWGYLGHRGTLEPMRGPWGGGSVRIEASLATLETIEEQLFLHCFQPSKVPGGRWGALGGRRESLGSP